MRLPVLAHRILVAGLLAAIACSSAVISSDGYGARMTPAVAHDLATLPSDQAYGAFVHFGSGNVLQHQAAVAMGGLKVGADFEKYAQTLYLTGTVAAFRALAAQPMVSYLEDNKRLEYFSDTATWATRVRVAQEPVSGGPYRGADGNVLRGQGTTIAVVDSGLDALHPDFAGRVLHNYKIVCSAPVPTEEICPGPIAYIDMGETDTDTTGGHGTHVTGIAAGSGAASTGPYPVDAAAPGVKGTYTGVAPDANIIHYGAGETLVILYAAEAFQHLLDNYDSFNPRVRVVSNSWGDGAGSTYDASSLLSQLTRALVAKGAVVAFAAGNGDTLGDGGDGTDGDHTSSYCKDPTPGVICVANYDDAGMGKLDGSLNSSSSRGQGGMPETYPDLAAPGTNITAACLQPQPGQAVCASGAETHWQPYYGTISGTSMATPHVAGAVALVAQASPSLSPAQIEQLFQNTARRVGSNGAYESDPQNPGGVTNFGFGAGLLNLQAALDSLGVAHGSLPAAGEQVIADGDSEPSIAGAADIVRLSFEETSSGGVPGLLYRLTLRDATDFGSASAVSLRVIANDNGRSNSTGVTLSPGGVSADPVSSSTSAPATTAAVSGNVVSFFVPLGRLGAPPVGAPVHNIYGASYLVSPLGTTLADRAPSASDQAQVADGDPMFGRPYTVLTASMPEVESRCEAPGTTLVTDRGGDSPTVLVTSVDANPDQDLLAARAWQPYDAAGNPVLVFRIKVSSLQLLSPGSSYYVSFNVPTIPAEVRGVRMEVTDPSAPIFYSYTASPSTGGIVDGRFVATGSQVPAEAGSGYDAATGEITIIVKPASLALSQAGQSLTGFNGGVTQTTDIAHLGRGATFVTDEMPDGLGRAGAFAFAANAACAPNTAPVASLSADRVKGPSPLKVGFTGSGTDADGDGIASYTFDFGDGSPAVTQAAPQAQHTYASAGTYHATVGVTDARGAPSANAAGVDIRVTGKKPH